MSHIVFRVSRTTEDSHTSIPQRVFSSATTRQLNWILYYFWLIDDPPSWLSPPWSLQLWNHSVLDYRECCFTERDVFWLFLFFIFFAVTDTFSLIETVQFLSPWWFRVTSTWWSQVDLRPVCVLTRAAPDAQACVCKHMQGFYLII